MQRKITKKIPAEKIIKQYLEAKGYIVANVSKVIPYSFIKQDLFGFADLIALKPNYIPLLVQATSYTNHSTRLLKITSSPTAIQAAKAKIYISVISTKKDPKIKHSFKIKTQHLILSAKEKLIPSTTHEILFNTKNQTIIEINTPGVERETLDENS